ncbi:MAG: flagellin [Planctomycetota bacterium]
MRTCRHLNYVFRTLMWLLEMANITKGQALVQEGISMLAQANTMPQMALNLL